MKLFQPCIPPLRHSANILKFIATFFLITASTVAQEPTTHDPSVPEELRIRGGLPNVFAKLASGESVRIAYLGGSITQANGWRPKTFAWFQEEFPEADIKQIDATVSGTGADFATCRLDKDLIRHKPDLVFIEYRVNGGGPGLEARSVEGLVRQIWRDNPSTDICFVYTIGHWMLNDLTKGNQFAFGAIMETIANYYRIPSIDLGVEVVKQMKNDTLIFQADQATEGKLLFSRDGVHPSDSGHELYTTVITRSLTKILKTGLPTPHPLPTPLEPLHFIDSSLMPVTTAAFSADWEPVDLINDLSYARSSRRKIDMLDKAMKCDKVGNSFTIEWTGTNLTLTHIPQGGDMEFEVSINGNKSGTYNPIQKSDKNLYTQFTYLPEQKQGTHTATLTITKLPPGTTFYIGQFLVFKKPIQ